MGREAKYHDGGQAAAAASAEADDPAIFPASDLSGLPVRDRAGGKIGRCVEALIGRADGRISYVVVGSTNAIGLDEELRAVARERCAFEEDAVMLEMVAAEFAALPIIADRDWPTRPPRRAKV